MSYEVYRKLRDDKGLTDYKVAEATGIPRSTFTSWKSGCYTPKAEKIRKLSEFFNVGIEVFYDVVPVDEEELPIKELSEEEKRLLDLFNKLDKADKDTILSNMRFLLEADKYKKDITSTAIS